MKNILFVIIILISSLGFVFAQTTEPKPLTQTEYVKMLYELQKNPNNKIALIEAIRTRGIGFELTDGLRGLTRTKSKNDEELRRTLEEANRRRQNPTTAKLPSEKEATEVLKKAREAALAAIEEMPDFVVKQQILRSYAYAGTGNYIANDRLVVAASYRSTGNEEYKILSVNGVLQENPQSKQSYEEAGGYTSVGEFVQFLGTIFKPETETKFTVVDTDLLRGRNTIVWSYEVNRDKATYRIGAGSTERVIVAGYKGKIWVDRENFRVIRFEMEATDIPSDYPIRSIHRFIEYDWVTINDEKYLLPATTDVRLISRNRTELIESRNRSRYKDYQKYGTEIQISDDEEEVKEEKPN